MSTDRRQFLKNLLAGSAAGALALQGFGGSLEAAQPPPVLPQLSSDKWSDFRAQFHPPQGMAWLNSATLGPMPDPVAASIQRSVLQLQHGSYIIPNSVREAVARLTKAAPSTIALTANTTHGLNIVAQGLPLRKGDEVILTDQEHAGHAVPWLARAQRDRLRIRVLEPGPDAASTLLRLEALITRRTKVIAVPHITCTTGQVLPVEEIIRRHSDRVPWILIDGAHGPGTRPLDLPSMKCGFYAACGHKWLCGPAGTGFLYIAPEMLEVLTPIHTGAGSDKAWSLNAYEQTLEGWADGAKRFEHGTQSRIQAEGLEAAITFFESAGLDAIEARTRELNRYLRTQVARLDWLEILTPAEEASYGSILSFRPTDLNRRLPFAAHIKAGDHFRIREVRESGLDCVRISLHAFNTEEEVDALMERILSWKS